MPDPVPEPNRLHAEMPRIPGVGDGAAGAGISSQVILAVVLAAVLVIGGGIAWRVVRAPKAKAAPTVDAEVQPAPPPFQASALPAETSADPLAVATIEQLAAPWSSKKFTFVDPVTQQNIPAIVIHIPGAAAFRSEAYWAFSLSAPYQRCELDYVTSISQIASKYGYRASHPMVVSACDGSVYDPLQVETIPSGAWVRGQVVGGAGIRPPIAINVRVQGHSLVADKIE